MNRAFISLYFFIVLSVVVLGWGLNIFWENIEPETTATREVDDIFLLVDNSLAQQNPENIALWLEQLNARLHHRISLFHPEDFADTRFASEISEGKTLHAIDHNQQAIWYRLDSRGQQIIAITEPAAQSANSLWYTGLLVVFYLGIAAAVFFWVWPLTRDLTKLEHYTRHIGSEGKEEPPVISARSAIFPLANAFNRMARRIRELLGSHKEMTYAVSHELRTPLARMKFSLAMLEADKPGDRQQLDKLQQDIHEMEGLISSLLLYAGFEQSNNSLRQEKGDMRSLIDQMLQRIERGPNNSVDICIDDRSGAKAFVCEWKLMEIVLQNLLQNALRFAEEKIIITLQISDDNQYSVSIEDDGPGIPVQDRERVFESFVRLYADAKKQKGGFGLGLSIVRRIMQWHDGAAEFIQPSRLGGGCIKISWPS